MTYIWQRWIADELRAAGLTVVEVEGWQNRGRPASTGSFNPTSGPTTHHTGATTWLERVIVTLRTLIIGRPDLPGPLCQVATAFNGVVYVIAAGRANHAGRIGKSGVKGMPLGADGNALALGNEVDTNGTQSLPPEQRHAIAVVNAVFLKHTGRPVDWAHRHADISGTGKWDIGSLTTNQLRTDADNATLEDDMAKYRDWDNDDKQALVDDLTKGFMRYKPKGQDRAIEQLIKQASNAPGLLRRLATKIGVSVDPGDDS